MKKTLSLLFIGALFGSTIALASVRIFSDVPSNAWYSNAVTSLSDKGIITGYPDGTFGPNNTVNRAELAVILDRTIKYIQTGKTTNTYSNSEHGLSFDYPNDWVIREEKSVDVVDDIQLRLKLGPVSNQNVNLEIYTPQLEASYEGFSTEHGFDRAITGLTQERADLLKWPETGSLIAQNIYFKNLNDSSTSLEFLYSANNVDFDGFLPQYYQILDSVRFN